MGGKATVNRHAHFTRQVAAAGQPMARLAAAYDYLRSALRALPAPDRDVQVWKVADDLFAVAVRVNGEPTK